MSNWTAIASDGTPVVKGDTVRDFRGHDWIFYGASRLPAGNSTGRVYVGDKIGPQREFFPSVFDLKIVDLETCSWCTEEVPDESLVETQDGARICPACQGQGEPAIKAAAYFGPDAAPPKCMTCGGLHLPEEEHSDLNAL